MKRSLAHSKRREKRGRGNVVHQWKSLDVQWSRDTEGAAIVGRALCSKESGKSRWTKEGLETRITRKQSDT